MLALHRQLTSLRAHFEAEQEVTAQAETAFAAIQQAAKRPRRDVPEAAASEFFVHGAARAAPPATLSLLEQQRATTFVPPFAKAAVPAPPLVRPTWVL